MRRYNEKTMPKCSWEHRDAFLTFSLSSGKVTINAAARQILWVHAGDQIEFFREPDSDDWFVGKVQKDGFKLSQHKGSHILTFARGQLIREVFASMAFTGKCARAYIVPHPVKWNNMLIWKLDLSRFVNQ